MSYYRNDPASEAPRRTSFDVVGEGIQLLNSNLGMWVVATLVFMAISLVANRPLQVVQQIQTSRMKFSGDFFETFMTFFRPPLIYWHFAAVPFTALVAPFRITMRKWPGQKRRNSVPRTQRMILPFCPG